MGNLRTEYEGAFVVLYLKLHVLFFFQKGMLLALLPIELILRMWQQIFSSL